MKKLVLITIATLLGATVQAADLESGVSARVILRQIVNENSYDVIKYGSTAALQQMKDLLNTMTGQNGNESISKFECQAPMDRSQVCEITIKDKTQTQDAPYSAKTNLPFLQTERFLYSVLWKIRAKLSICSQFKKSVA